MRGLLAFAVAAAAAASVAAGSAPAAPAKTCRVPSITGLKQADARAKLEAAGCPARMNVVGTCVKAKSNQGVVLDQKPRPALVLRKGSKVSVHIGKDCPEPPPPPPEPVPTAAEFAGVYDGTYEGVWEGIGECDDIPVGGFAEIWVEQTGTVAFDVHFAMQAMSVSFNVEDCKEFGERRDSEGITEMTYANGKLSAPGYTVTLSGDVLKGTIEARGGKFQFTLSRRKP